MQIIISPENAAPLTKHCELIGWTPEELANDLLTEPLTCSTTRAADSSEPFRGAIDHPDQATAQRALTKVAQIVTIQFGG